MNPYEPPFTNDEPEVSLDGVECIRFSALPLLVMFCLTLVATVALAYEYGSKGVTSRFMIVVACLPVVPIVLIRYLFNRLWLTPCAIVQRTLFGSNAIRICDVIHLEWKPKPIGGAVVIRHPSKQITINLGEYDQRDKEKIALFLRQNIPLDRQTGWRG